MKGKIWGKGKEQERKEEWIQNTGKKNWYKKFLEGVGLDMTIKEHILNTYGVRDILYLSGSAHRPIWATLEGGLNVSQMKFCKFLNY